MTDGVGALLAPWNRVLAMLTAVLAGFALAMLAPWVNAIARRATGTVLALGPLGMFIYFASLIGPVSQGETIVTSFGWVAELGVNLSFHLDGLSLLFALLITGIGTLIVFYAGAYLEGHRDRGRFYLWLLAFLASMLGLVLADNVISLFIFWELTSITSYFLIGFDHHREKARKSALQALLVTGSGGLALLAGLILVGVTSGQWELSQLLADPAAMAAMREHALFMPIMVLLLLGAFTKSAQFPFHFWLPNAMEAPTPVSAYLHSSTMVKAGIYLMARFSPVMSGSQEWMIALTVFGGATMVIGAYLAVRQVYLKRILAYSTVSALGVLTFLLGLGAAGGGPDAGGAELSLYAAKAFAVFLLAHALYKATLFLVAGTITHETGEKDVRKLGGMWRAMPITMIAAVLAALSMAGFPPFFGFISKEYLFEATLKEPGWGVLLTAAAVLSGVLFVVVSCLVAVRPFFGARVETPQHPHEAPLPMWFGPAALGIAGLAFGLLPGLVGEPLMSPLVTALLGSSELIKVSLISIFNIHFNIALVLGGIVLAVGVVLFLLHNRISRMIEPFDTLNRIGPERWYDWGLAALTWFAAAQTRVLQSGYLRVYLRITIFTAVGLIVFTILRLENLAIIPDAPAGGWVSLLYDDLYKLIAAVLILVGTYGAVHSRSRLAAIASLGIVGYGVALIYLLYGAPDLAITQFLVETLTVILFVFVFYHLPESPRFSGMATRLRDLIAAVTAGAMMTLLVLLALNVQLRESISSFFIARSVPDGHGRNIVNVILVDFRAMDTLGEITVLAVSAAGVLALLRLRPKVLPISRRRAT